MSGVRLERNPPEVQSVEQQVTQLMVLLKNGKRKLRDAQDRLQGGLRIVTWLVFAIQNRWRIPDEWQYFAALLKLYWGHSCTF